PVRHLRAERDHVELRCIDSLGHSASLHAERVLLAIPPRLAVDALQFTPTLPAALVRQWQATPAWMASHAQYVAVYDTPCWREQGLSGEARSAAGPLAEIHDASMPGGKAALFGFLGTPARVREGVPEDILRARCRSQLVRLFGAAAGAPIDELFKDWA